MKYVEIIQTKLNVLGYANKVTGYVVKPPDFQNDETRIAIARFNHDMNYENGGYINATFLKNLDREYKRKASSTPLPDSYFSGWNKKLTYYPGNVIPSSSSIKPAGNINPIDPFSKPVKVVEGLPRGVKIGGGLVLGYIVLKHFKII